MHRTVLAAAVALATASGPAAQAADPLGLTTIDARVVPAGEGGGAYTPLTLGPSDPVDVRGELAPAAPGREQRRRSLLYLAQLTDFQLADEESPARVEFLDPLADAFAGAWRPQEALMPFVVDASVRQIDAHRRSPFAQAGGRRARMALTVLTGDNADNNQRNEARWVVRLLEGGRLDPNSGRADAEALQGDGCAGADRRALAAEARRYTGVQDAADLGREGGFYDPDRPSGRFSGWPAYPGLLDRAQRPFHARGLDVPSYVAIGNHDALVQGNLAARAFTDRIATGCRKLLLAPPVARAAAPEALSAVQPPGAPRELVPPDPGRGELTKAQYRALFAGGRQADAHGFAFVDPAEATASRGAASHYSFVPTPGVRLVALDTTTTAGIPGPGAAGNLDDPQFRWLRRTLDAAEAAGELVVVFSHHGPGSMTGALPDELAGACDDPAYVADPGCDADPRDSSPIHLGADVTRLLLDHPHVIAWLAGHSHVNDVALARREAGAPGGLWIVRTSAEADFPHQDRLIDVMDNRDGTLSLLSALIDDAAPAQAPPAGTPGTRMGPRALASIARTLGFNDPQRRPSAIGAEQDRNVELLLSDPRG